MRYTKSRQISSKLLNMPRQRSENWKMNEFRFYEVPFPTLAREFSSMKGTTWEPSDESRYGIVARARGYDTFFNIGEVPWTTVRVSYISSARSLTSFGQ